MEYIYRQSAQKFTDKIMKIVMSSISLILFVLGCSGNTEKTENPKLINDSASIDEAHLLDSLAEKYGVQALLDIDLSDLQTKEIQELLKDSVNVFYQRLSPTDAFLINSKIYCQFQYGSLLKRSLTIILEIDSVSYKIMSPLIKKNISMSNRGLDDLLLASTHATFRLTGVRLNHHQRYESSSEVIYDEEYQHADVVINSKIVSTSMRPTLYGKFLSIVE